MGILKKFGQYLMQSLFTWAVMSLSFNVLAEELNEVDSQALANTMKMMQNPIAREGAIKENGKEAKAADKMAKDLMGSDENVEDMYKVAAEIFRTVATENGGDLDKMVDMMRDAQANPQGFYQKLTPEQKEMIKNLGDKVKDQQKINNN